jgi:transcriptional regulator with XRE-family HTH domain
MLALPKVREIERLLLEGKLSYRRIATTLGVSRSTVSAIANGKRPDYEARLRARLADEEPLGPLARCPTCGGRVYLPCRLCRVRQLKAQERETLRAMRRHARQLALRRLLSALRQAAERENRPSPRT